MTILFRYMLREYVKIFGMCFSGLMTIYLVIDFFEKVRRFLRYDAHALDVLAYFVLKMPAISYQIAPLAVLMATLLTIGLLSRSHEITAMRSCGISLYWITSPFIFLGTVLAMVLFLFSSTVIPLALAKAEQIKTTQIEKRTTPVSLKAAQLGEPRRPDLDEHRYHRPGGAVLRNIRLYRLSPTFQLQEIAEAKRAVYSPQGWALHEGFSRLPRGRHRLGHQFSDAAAGTSTHSGRLHHLGGVGPGNDDASRDSRVRRSAAIGGNAPAAPADGLLWAHRFSLRDAYHGDRRHRVEPSPHRRSRQRYGYGYRPGDGRRLFLLVHHPWRLR